MAAAGLTLRDTRCGPRRDVPQLLPQQTVRGRCPQTPPEHGQDPTLRPGRRSASCPRGGRPRPRHADGAHAPPMLGARSRVGGGRPHGTCRLGRQHRGPALPPPSATRRADRPGGSSRLGSVSAWTVTVSGRVTSRPQAHPPPGNRGGHGDPARSVSHIQEPKAQTWAAGRAAPGWPHAGSVLSPGHVQEETSLTLPSGRSVPGPPGAQGRPRRTRREPGRHHS